MPGKNKQNKTNNNNNNNNRSLYSHDHLFTMFMYIKNFEKTIAKKQKQHYVQTWRLDLRQGDPKLRCSKKLTPGLRFTVM